MKRPGLTALAFLILVPVFSQEGDSLSYISLDPAQFSEEMQIVTDPQLLDVREVFEYRRSRIPGAVNMPSFSNLDKYTDTISLAAHLFLYCTSDFRSRQVAKHLAGKGFIHVYDLEGGIAAWKKEGFPLDRKRLGRRGGKQ